jgi:hypothetical protein
VDQAQVLLLVRATARVSAAAFAAALILFIIRTRYRPHSAPYHIFAFVTFIVVHTIHFGTVLWLAALTSGRNIQERDGWAVVVATGVLFYVVTLGILQTWRRRQSAGRLSRGRRLAANAGVALVALVFLNSYVARIEHMPVYWLPASALVVIVAWYLAQEPASALRASARQAERS